MGDFRSWIHQLVRISPFLGLECGSAATIHVILSFVAGTDWLLSEALKRYRVKYIFGYSSSLFALAQEL